MACHRGIERNDPNALQEWSFISLRVTGGTPAPVVRTVSTKGMCILRTPAMVEHLRAMGVQPIGGTPEKTDTFIRAATAKRGAVIKASGATAQ